MRYSLGTFVEAAGRSPGFSVTTIRGICDGKLAIIENSYMDTVFLGLVLTPQGHLILAPQSDAPSLETVLAERLQDAFQRGSGHGLLQLGAAETRTTLPPVFSYWREFGARFVTTLCTQPGMEAASPGTEATSEAAQREAVHVPRPGLAAVGR